MPEQLPQIDMDGIKARWNGHNGTLRGATLPPATEVRDQAVQDIAALVAYSELLFNRLYSLVETAGTLDDQVQEARRALGRAVPFYADEII